MELLKFLFILWFAASVYCDGENPETDIGQNKTITEDSSAVSLTESDITVANDGNETVSEDVFTSNDTSTTSLSPSENATTPDDILSNWTACMQNPCLNGGECQDDFFNQHLYSCVCPIGYIGNLCQVKDTCEKNENGALCHNGACVYSDDYSIRFCECFLTTIWDDLKKECRVEQPPCFPNPCLNGGNCSIIKNGEYKCECSSGYEGMDCKVKNKCDKRDKCENGSCIMSDDGNIKYCHCNEELYWNAETKLCEAIKPPCVPNPCQNNGHCAVISYQEYNCTCEGHYTDRKCRNPDLCYSTENGELCGGNGICLDNKCICDEKFYLDEVTHTCKNTVKPCFPNPCQNGGFCVSLDSENYNCTCSEGFTGHNCAEPNFCVLLGGSITCGDSTCRNSPSQSIFYCTCDEGHFFNYGNSKCEKIDYCPLMSCSENEKCVNNECVCKQYYKWNNDTQKCEANICAFNPCPTDGMICSEGETLQDFDCSCKKGFSFNGKRCAETVCDIPGFNDCEQICHSTENSYSCDCYNNYNYTLKEDNRTCSFEGNLTCNNKTCDRGICVNINDEEICKCPPGFEDIDGKCIDKCTAGTLPAGLCPDNECEATEDGFRCKCERKYILSTDEITCTNRRLCAEGEVGWLSCQAMDAECKDDWKSDLGYECKCRFPQVKSEQGICEDECSNLDYQRKCSDLGGKCDMDTMGNMTCQCPPLYQNSKEGKTCKTQADFSYLLTVPVDLNSYKMQVPKITRMKRSLEDQESTANYFQIKIDVGKAIGKLFPQLDNINILNCKELDGYYLCTLELQFDYSIEKEYNRLKVPGICSASQDSVEKCILPPSLVLRKDRLNTDLNIQKTVPCEVNVKNNLCGSETYCVSFDSNKSFNCSCMSGFSMKNRVFPFEDSSSVIEICNDIDECLDKNACPAYSTCQNTIGGYTCSCMPGFREKNRDSDPKTDGCVEICHPNPCDNGVCEIKGDHDFECRCEKGFAGALCDLSDSNFRHARTNTIIVGAVLGGALLVTIIIFIVTVSRLKKRKYQNDDDNMMYGTEMTERHSGGNVNNAYARE